MNRQHLVATGITGGGGLQYWQKVKNTFGANLIEYWPLNEASGVVAADASGNNRNAAYKASGVTYGEVGVGDGKTSIKLATSYVNLYSAGLAAAFNGAEGTLAVWAKVADANLWTDGAIHYLAQVRVDANNKAYIRKTATNNQLEFVYSAGGANETITTTLSATGWFHVALTWSKSGDAATAYVNGVSVGSSNTLGVFAGALAATVNCLGASDTSSGSPWAGWMAHALLLNRAATQPELASIVSPFA